MANQKYNPLEPVITEKDYIDNLEPVTALKEIRKNEHQNTQRIIAY